MKIKSPPVWEGNFERGNHGIYFFNQDEKRLGVSDPGIQGWEKMEAENEAGL